MPLFSPIEIYEHYLSASEWHRATQLPSILCFIERISSLCDLIRDSKIQDHNKINLEHVPRSMSSTGAVNGGGSRKSYEAFETYGDTLLKFLSTFYVFKKFDNKNSLSKMRLKDNS